MKIINPKNIFAIWTRREVFLELKPYGHNNTVTTASNLKAELHNEGERHNEQQYRKALYSFFSKSMELPTNLMEEIAFNTRPKIEEHLLISMDQSTHKEHLSQPLQTNTK